MATTEAYMLQRDSQESKRLDTQHVFLCALSGGQLVHPSIPRKDIRTVADVATGTGVWLRDVAACAEFPAHANSKKNTFVGFDISPQQFPSMETVSANMKLVVHDITEPLPLEYHEKFDLVNVRLMSYAIKAADLDRVVWNVLQILRPGGFLQWQECDACDIWATPETPMTTASINYVISEKIARGLSPGIATSLLKMIQSYSTPIPDGQLNPISQSPQLIRITQLETVSTYNHNSPLVAAGKKPLILSVVAELLGAGLVRRKAAIGDSSTPTGEGETLLQESREIEELIEALKHGGHQIRENWEFEMTWIVARKAILVNKSDAWMSVKHPA
ncbi:hypothetical protein MMC22_003725 [Lobaria immixta]|nr:hypothetical protein [Lobaria immixta]